MQVTGTFPELSAGRTKSGKGRSKKMAAPTGGFAGFSASGRAPRRSATNATTFAGRRSASHAKAYTK